MTAAPRRLVLAAGVFLREVDDRLVAEKPGLRVTVRDPTTIDVLKRASSGGDVGAGAAVDALVEAGLLEPGLDRPNDYLVGLRGRYDADLVEVARRNLADATVVVVGDGWTAARIVRALTDSGVGGSSPVPDLVVDLAGTTGDVGDVPVLPAVCTADGIVVGPVLGGAAGRCRVCCRPGAAAPGWTGRPRRDRAVGAGLVSAAVLAYLNGLRPCDVLTVSIRFDPRTGRTDLVPPAGDIACAECGIHDPAPPHPTAHVAWSYERSVETPIGRAGPAERWLSVRSRSVFRRRHLNMPPVRLSVLPLLDAALAAAPTVEGIGTSSVYVLPGGAYYDPDERRLFPPTLPTADTATAGFSLCVTGNLAGAEVCFGRFARKVVLQDAGLLVAQLLSDGSRLGLEPAVRPAAGVRSALDLAASEYPLAVVDVRADGAAALRADRAAEPVPAPSADAAVDTIRRRWPWLLDDLVLHHRPAVLLVASDLQAAVYRGGADAYASAVLRAAAVAHYISSATGGRLLLKVPPRLLERSDRSRLRVLSAVTTR